MTVLLCVVLVLSAVVHAGAALVIVSRLDAFVRYCQNEPEAHPIRRMFRRITRREQVRRAGIPMRAA